MVAGGGGPHGGGISSLVHRIFQPKTLIFAALGAAAGAMFPPLAVIGGPIGGAVGGALLAQVI
jgi:hypothetical protein